MLALWHLYLSSMPRGVKNAVRLVSLLMSVGSHPLVLRSLIFCVQLILMPNPNLDHCAPIGLKPMILRPCTRIYQMRLFKKSCVSY